MYATRRNYVKQWDFQKPEERYSVVVRKGRKPDPHIKPERISYVEEEVMYWRKANHIHQWFVDNVQEGNDDCGYYYVSPDNLRTLLAVCNEVIMKSELVDGRVHNGTVYSKDHPQGEAQLEPGLIIKNDTTAKELLPVSEGFFFGSYDYNEWYLNDVIDTRDWIAGMVEELKSNPAALDGIFYHSSW